MPGSILFPTEVSMYDTEKAFYRHYEYIQKENSLYSRWFQKRGLSYRCCLCFFLLHVLYLAFCYAVPDP